MISRDRIEQEHADATHGYRVDPDERPSKQELREDQREIDNALRNSPRRYVNGWEMRIAAIPAANRPGPSRRTRW